MRRIIIKEARPGMVAARTLVATENAQRVEVAKAGEVLGVEHLVRLHELGLYDLWVIDPGLEFFDEMCVQPTAGQLRLAEGLRDSFLRLSGWVSRALLKRHSSVLEEVVRGLIRGAPVVPCFGAFAEDEALLAHSCDVAAVSILLGLQLEGYLVEQRRRLDCRHAREVGSLALGALFHDVGEVMLPAQQRESRQACFDSEDWMQHTEEGHALVRGRVDPSAVAVVMHHHQRFDGTGFAGGAAGSGSGADAGHRALAGEGIHVFARIVMAADEFCRTLFAGARLPQPMVMALWKMQQVPLRSAFDPVVHGCLLGMFQPFVAGMVVMLNDQSQALVTGVEGQYPCYPEVRVLQGGEGEAGGVGVIKLAERSDLRVEVVDGMEVEGYLYGVRKAAPLAA